MAPVHNLREHLKVFDLTVHATIQDLDNQYSYLSNEIYKEKKTNPRRFGEQQQALDDHYYPLLQEYIRRDCQEGNYAPDMNLDIANVIHRRTDPGVFKDARRSRMIGEIDLDMRRKTSTEHWTFGNEDQEDEKSDGDDESIADENSDDDGDGEGEGDRESEVAATDQYRESSTPSSQSSRTFELVESEGDIFDAPDNAVIVHAVSCQGVWGRGFAAELQRRFPAAYAEYAYWCRTTKPKSLLAGNCLLIPPQKADYAGRGKLQPRRWIACLFTSEGFGWPNSRTENPGRDDRETILMQTDSALIDLRSDLFKVRTMSGLKDPVDLYSPRFNAGCFGVPWKETKVIISMCFAGYSATWHVISLPENEESPI